MKEQLMYQAPQKYNVLLLGDCCIDEYHYGSVDRISPEAPVPIFVKGNNFSTAGMAGNVESNFRALGLNPHCIFGNKQSIKRRYIDTKTHQHVLRVDEDLISDPITLPKDLSVFDMIVVSDYNKGSITSTTYIDIQDSFSGPVFIDTKKTDLISHPNWRFKINKLEYSKLQRPNTANVIVTLGSQGALYRDKVFSVQPVDVVDVVGAGDTFLAALSWCFIQGNTIEEAIMFANKAARITVMHHGVYAPTLEEIL